MKESDREISEHKLSKSELHPAVMTDSFACGLTILTIYYLIAKADDDSLQIWSDFT